MLAAAEGVEEVVMMGIHLARQLLQLLPMMKVPLLVAQVKGAALILVGMVGGREAGKEEVEVVVVLVLRPHHPHRASPLSLRVVVLVGPDNPVQMSLFSKAAPLRSRGPV
ncbi:hypothetical protein A3D62_01605 [Candidatus Kaiserbacteria bacterium RIFCSPHIGHO2_02_FULL_49_11]|uniref:Uncharacterized protein n=1 Tax=Candidatus Kaiserbacteria bacterium RIFCSPHIGHO2_02_FULL_49_11 TaxID=1798489 RepID=A0A1F6D1V2_9BACT|nr:MAG: hypothetical protein A3D62_01605 [Candidatus Kaiserbacteria bacterium RIFCSPHIGHO2_02_FULL_49_11]